MFRKKRKKPSWWTVPIGLIVFAFALNMCSDDAPTPDSAPAATSVSSTKESSDAPTPDSAPAAMEYMLACLDEGPVSRTSFYVTRFRDLLLRLEGKTNNTQREIGDMTVVGQQILEERWGVRLGLYELMFAADEAIPPGVRVEYSEHIVALVWLIGPQRGP